MTKLWGGRFSKQTSDLVDRFNASIEFDSRLWEYDIQGSMAHARMLGRCGIIPESDSEAIVSGLQGIAEDIGAGKVEFDLAAEDIHMNVESLLKARIGEPAGRLHTGRSRNDQVALDLRLYLKARITEVSLEIAAFQKTLIEIAESYLYSPMPGYTHLQHAQPVTLGHHLLAYVWMFQRDRERLGDCRRRTDVLPLGSGAMAGTSFPIDREYVAEQLGFSRISENSMDAVSDRDFAVEFLSAAALIGMHVSRLAEEVVIWNTREFGFIELDDAIATGSSLMPQKKNPDVAELARGKTGRLYGNLLALLTAMKGLTLAYNKDFQEDKEAVFDSVDTLLITIPVMRELLQTASFRTERMLGSMKGDFSTATDLADYLVRRGVPFRSAHETVGLIVAECLNSGRSLEELNAADLSSFAPEFAQSGELGSIEQSLRERDVPGSTAPSRLREQLAAARKAVLEG